ncbi:STAS domain-containing protein [Actinokineospora auranticolor]|uniref:STAS domain-containing protein n=1 Tax=Actinokineospora auranticolor TaxID=155976 RepID=UPI0011B0C3FD|nr:STAS domain-containing protein [Actinokineospora auranticolor]
METAVEREHQGGVMVLRMRGEFDLGTAGVLETGLFGGLAQAADDGVLLVIADLDGIGFLGSVALTAFTRAHEQARNQGIDLVFVVGSSNVAGRALQVSRLDRILAIAESVEHAMVTGPRNPE